MCADNLLYMGLETLLLGLLSLELSCEMERQGSEGVVLGLASSGLQHQSSLWALCRLPFCDAWIGLQNPSVYVIWS